MASPLHRGLVAAASLLWLAAPARAASPAQGPAAARPLALTDDERAWVRDHPLVRVVTLDDYAPYLFTQPDGTLAGLSVNLIDLIAQRTGLKFEYLRFKSVGPALTAFKSGEGDLLPALAYSREREQFVRFSQPYATAFSVIVTRVDAPYLNALQELDGVRVGSLRGAVQNQLILAAAPGARTVEYATVQDSLVALAAGEVDATYASVGTAAYYIKRLQLSNLRLGSVVGESMALHVGVRRDWPLLATIIDKALADITPAERKLLDDQWIFVAQAPNRWLPWLRAAAGVAIAAVAVAGLLLYFYRRMARELAARLRMQAELERAHAALARANAEKTEMMRTIAHDLRNPITGLMVGNEVLRGLVDPTNELATEMLSTQRSACENILARVDELVNPAVLETGRRALAWTQVDLVARLRESIDELAEAARAKRIAITLASATPTMSFLSDKAALRHVVDNLLSNAVKYSQLDRAIRVEVEREDDGYLLKVSDQGPGVPPAEREAIFERFAQGSAKPTAGEKSTGLGLWIVRRTVGELHGRVWCGPGPGGQGATFFVFLPLAPPAGPAGS